LTSNLSAFDDLDGAASEWLADLAKRGADTTGAANGIACSDEVTGPLTCNMGVVTFESGHGNHGLQRPLPGDPGRRNASRAVHAKRRPNRLRRRKPVTHPAALLPVDAEPVKTLLRVYREHTGDMTPPKTMGGRTYATTVAPVGVAFGAMREGDPDAAHQANEKIAVARLVECAKIYAHALYELAK
jgi:succinyl-diaminopimelate desuccinylase